jgi:hypothetical protein
MQSATLPVQQAHNSVVNAEGASGAIRREELHQAGMLVACFVLPVEQAEKLVSMLQDIARNPAGEVQAKFGPAGDHFRDAILFLAEPRRSGLLSRIAASTLYRYAQQERIECRKIGNRLEYRRASLDRFKEQQIRPARRSRARGIIAPTLGSGN